jgi:hypothetical protein
VTSAVIIDGNIRLSPFILVKSIETGLTVSQVVKLDAMYSTAQTPFKPHGEKYFHVDGDDRKGTFVENGTFVVFAPVDASGHPQPADYNKFVSSFLVVYRWVGNKWMKETSEYKADVSVMGVNVTAYTHLAFSTGYYAYEWHCTSNVTEEIYLRQFTITTGINSDSMIGIKPLPLLDNKAGTISAARMSAVSLLCTNTTPEMFSGGTIYGVQYTATDSLGDILANMSSTGAENASEYFTSIDGVFSGNARKGAYGWHRPLGLQCFESKMVFRHRDGQEYGCYNPIQPCGGWLTCFAAPALTEAETATFMCVATAHVEYETTDIWYEREKATCGPVDWEMASRLLKNTPQWDENPLHFRDIARAITGGVRKVAAWSPTILKAISLFNPEAAAFLPIAEAASALVK